MVLVPAILAKRASKSRMQTGRTDIMTHGIRIRRHGNALPTAPRSGSLASQSNIVRGLVAWENPTVQSSWSDLPNAAGTVLCIRVWRTSIASLSSGLQSPSEG
eukprot:597644-Amphidinium_carterae.1